MLYRSIIYVLLAIVIFGCTIIQENRLQYQAIIRNVEAEVIPFYYVKKLIIVEASVNTSGQRKFIFDTGAFQSKVEFSLAEQLGLEKVYSRDNGSAQGISRKLNITSIDSLQLSSLNYYNIGAGVLKYSPDSYSQCVAESGIIGSNLIKLSNWKIDYQKKELTTSEKPLYPKNQENTAQLKFKTSYLSGIPLVDLEIEGRFIKDVKLDLGYNGGIIIPKKYASQFKSTDTESVADQSTSGIFGSKRDDIAIKYLNLNFGKDSTRVPINFSSSDKGLIGNDFLEHFTIYIDYDNEVIILEKTSNIEIDKPRVFIPGILNDTLWIVDKIHSESVLKIGDTLKSVNGYKPKDVFSSNCDYFLNISKLFEEDSIIVTSLKDEFIEIQSR